MLPFAGGAAGDFAFADAVATAAKLSALVAANSGVTLKGVEPSLAAAPDPTTRAGVILADDETSGAKALNNEESAILEVLEHIFDGLGDKNQDGKGLTEGATGVGGVGKGIVAIRRYHPAKRHDT